VKKKILIFGGSGLLGTNYIKTYGKKNIILATYFKNRPKFKELSNIKLIKIDIKMTHQKIIKKLKKFKPDYIFNFSGISSVDYCEKKKKECNAVIFRGLKKIVKISKFYNSYLVHISTDSLFGHNEKFKSENKKFISLNYYSKLKIDCEKYLKNNYNNCLIVRTRFFGYTFKNKKENFFEEILQNLDCNKKVFCYENVYSTPISVENLIKILEKFSNKKITGVFNIVSNERVSRYEFARTVAKIFKLDKNLIKKIKLDNKKERIKRTFDTSLSNLKMKNKIKFKFDTLRKSLIKLKNEKKNSSCSSCF